ncbi:MAG: hypothetical protein AB7D03_12290, partial [Thiomicrospira sp.]
LQIQVTVDAVADIPVNDGLATDTATDDDNHANNFTLVATEDGGPINLKSVFANAAALDSNDDDGSETLTFKLTGLADGFGINGATFIGGSGEGRIWYIDSADLLADKVSLTTPTHFAGQENFQIRFVTTEQAGDSKTHAEKVITVMITPVAEASAAINLNDTQDEDVAKVLNFGFSTPDTDGPNAGKETLKSFSIDVTGLEAAGVKLVSDGVDLTTGKSGHQTINVTDGVLAAVTATLAEDSDADYSFKISYTYQDVAVDADGNTYTDTVTKTDQLYSVTVNAITDDINLALSTKATDAGISDNGGKIIVTQNGTFTKTLTVTGVDSDGRGHADTDSSEEFTRVTVSGVPEGITVVGGYYAGDTGGGNYSGFWYVDIPNQALDADGATYDLVFDVDGSFDNDDIGDYPITVSAYNQETNNSAEQSDSEQFTLRIDNVINGAGLGVPAQIVAFYQDIDQDNKTTPNDHAGNSDHGVVVSSTGSTSVTDTDAYAKSVLREDTPFKLSDVVHVKTNNANSAFSITLKDVPPGVTITGMTLNDDGFYTRSGSGQEQAIIDALKAITITPASNMNTDANDIANTDLAFDIELTTYATGGALNNALIHFTGSVLPVTDEMDLTVVNDGATNEDVAHTFSIKLDNSADAAKTQIIGDKLYLQLSENYTDIQGSDGANGSLVYNGATLTTSAVSGVTDIADGQYYVINDVNYNDTLNFTYHPASNRDGSVTVDVYVQNKEGEDWNPYDTQILTSSKQLSFNVHPVVDGFNLGGGAGISGDEDTLVLMNLGLTNTDSSEILASVSINGLPNGFLLYYGEQANGSDKALANNLGNDGSVTMQMRYGVDENVATNQWHLPLNAGALPGYIWLQPPENWSGSLPDITVSAVDAAGNVSSATIAGGTVAPVVDDITINPTASIGDAYQWIALNLNANMQDLDGSETMTLTLTGSAALDNTALFKIEGGAVLTAAQASFNAGTWTLSNIAYSDINKLQIFYQAYDGQITAVAKTVEQANTGLVSAGQTETFDLKIDAPTQVTFDKAIDQYQIKYDFATSVLTLKDGATEYVLKSLTQISFNGTAYTLKIGTSGVDSISATGGKDLIIAGAGQDTITADADDYVVSGDGAAFTTPVLFSSLDTAGNAEGTANNGVIIDGIIAGMSYQTSSGLAGLTDTTGGFQYREGDSVTFSVGGVVIGTATPEDLALGAVFLQDLADVARTDLNSDYVQKMAVFLQSLDSRGTTADGIQIDAAAAQALAGLSLNLSAMSMEQVAQLVSSIGYAPVDVETAMDHVRDMLIAHTALTEDDFDPLDNAVSADSLDEALALLEDDDSLESANDEVVDDEVVDDEVVDDEVVDDEVVDDEVVDDEVVDDASESWLEEEALLIDEQAFDASESSDDTPDLPGLDDIFEPEAEDELPLGGVESEQDDAPIAEGAAETPVFIDDTPPVMPHPEEQTDF